MALRCIEPFTYIDAAGIPRSLSAGDLVDDKNPAVKLAPFRFEPVEVTVARSVEQATAAPGEKRATRKAPAK